MGHGSDRRPWLIISRREAIALSRAVRGQNYEPEDLQRGLQTIESTLDWLDGIPGSVRSSDEALKTRAAELG